MVRIPTFWRGNTAKADGVTYSSSTVAYSSSTTSYSSSSAALDEFGKTPGAWAPVPKVATAWSPNAAATTNYYLFDSASRAYDSSSDSYDGIATDLDTGNTNTPTAWSPA